MLPTFTLTGKNSKGQKYIYFSVSMHGHRIRRNIGYKVYPYEWDKKRQIVTIKNDLYKVINNEIDRLIEQSELAEKHFILLNIRPSKKDIETRIFDPPIVKSIDFFTGFDQYIRQKSFQVSPDTLKTYTTLKSRLLKFNPHITELNKDIVYEYEKWSIRQKYGSNLILKHISILKNYIKLSGGTIDYKSSLKKQKFDSIALNEQEIQKIYNLKVPDYLENAKIRFITMCCTAMRLGDSKRFGPSNLININGEMCIKYLQYKTKTRCVIPLNLFKMLQDCVSIGYRVTSDAKFRSYIKKLGYLAGLTSLVELGVEKGGRTTYHDFPKYKCITPHTARRSFVTCMFFRGYPPQEVMLMSGHSLKEIIEIYDKTKSDENAVKISKLLKNK